jgi:membrane protein implicated in regulation of membrane protease activity
MNIFEIIGLVEPWTFFIAAIFLIAVAAMIGEITIIPWISLAIVFVGIADYFQMSVENQLIVFCLALSVSTYLSHRFISIAGAQPLIAEEISDMVGKKVTVVKVEPHGLESGSARSENGKIWNVRHSKNQKLLMNHEYLCSGVSGITLIIGEVNYE